MYEPNPDFKFGLLDVSTCYNNAPLIMSFPHYLLSNYSLFQNISNLEPNVSAHSSYLKIDPVSGITTDFILRYQYNIRVSEYDLDGVRKASKDIYPLLWVELSGTPTENLNNFLYYTVDIPEYFLNNMLPKALFVLLCIIVIVCSHLYLTREEFCWNRKRRTQENSPLNFGIVKSYLSVRCIGAADDVQTGTSDPAPSSSGLTSERCQGNNKDCDS
ncbi:scavenger receptor class B member 1-like [Uloborus diversus]|uniref:scavenger receptor class B member 1-like n=1 Tax=Uloborus diversus TaxID=327109 RepID=UPI0024095C08|nr:scavenger receptor class B member 1-like [Uloborus diversus]